MAVEVARLLGEQLAHESEASSRRSPDDPSVMFYKHQLIFLEELILGCRLLGKPAEAIEAVRQLQSNIKEWRRRREQRAIEAQIMLKEREAARAAPAPDLDPFAVLLRGSQEDESQHNVTERRRLNLLEEIGKRPRGTKSMLARAMGCTLPRLSQLISDPSSQWHRTISDDVARTMERALNLKRGALDRIESRPYIVSIQKSVTQLAAVAKKLRHR